MSIVPILSTVSTSKIGSITGCLLGDGSIRTRSNTPITQGNARFSITLKESSKNYLDHLRTTVFSDFKCSKLVAYPNILLP